MSVTCFGSGVSGGSAIGNVILMKLSETSFAVTSMVVMISQSQNGFGLDAVGLLSAVMGKNLISQVI